MSDREDFEKWYTKYFGFNEGRWGMTDKHQCDRCDCEVDASDKLSDGSYRCDECFTFFAELNWYDPDDRAERIEDYLETKREET